MKSVPLSNANALGESITVPACPRELALDLLFVEALADPAKAVAYGLGVPSIFDGKDLAQEVGDLLEGNETRALGLEVEPFRSDEAMAEPVAELREGSPGRVETGVVTTRRWKGCKDLLPFLESEAKFLKPQVATTLDGGDGLFVILSPVSVGHDLDNPSHAPLPGHLR